MSLTNELNSMLTSAMVAAIICLAYFVQAAFALGGPLLAVPLLSQIIGVKNSVVITTIFSLVGSVLLLHLWQYIDWQKIRWLIPGILSGVSSGLFLFSVMNEHILMLVLAFYIIVYTAGELSGRKFSFGSILPVKTLPFLSSFSAGFIQGATGVGGGPPLVAYLKSNMKSINEYRATYMLTWLVGNAVRLLFMSLADFVHGATVMYILITLPFFVVALYAGYHLPKKLNLHTFNIALNVLLLISAISILIKQFV